MKRILVWLAVSFLAAGLASAQEIKKPRFNPDLTWNTVRSAYGVRMPMTSDKAPDGSFFSLDLTPAFHYLVTNNFSEYRQQIDPADGSPIGSPTLKPLRWQFSIGFGLSYLF